MVEQEQIDRSRQIQQRTGKTFHLATRLLPERVREPTYVLYAFFRVADEVVDGEPAAELSPAAQRERLESLRRQALGEEPADEPVLAAFSEMRERHDIADEDVDVFVDAMLSDIDKSRYETYEELEAYMDGSAAAVGRMMTAVMDPGSGEREKALPHATALGEAFQLSNFLRDVREDVVERDRIYLPLETLRRHGVDEAQVRALEFDEQFAAAMKDELSRTEALYEEGVAGIKYLPDDCQFAVLLAAVLYADHHRSIRRLDYDVLSETPSLSTPRKLWLLARTRWAWSWNRDPEAVFRRVSTIGRTDRRSHGGEPAEPQPGW
jgi:phytoene synthase